MIQVTDKFGINILPDSYAVATIACVNKKTGEPIFKNKWYYAAFEDALIKISRMTEKCHVEDLRSLNEAIIAVQELHRNTDNMIRQAVKAAKFPKK